MNILTELISNNTWKCLSIFGPPGSGKSQIVKRLSQYLLEREKSVVVFLSPLDFKDNFGVSGVDKFNKDIAYQLILKILTDRLWGQFDRNDVSKQACEHVVNKFLRTSPSKLVLVGDEIDSLKILRSAMEGLQKVQPSFGIKLIFVRRIKPQDESLSVDHIYHETKLFNIEESKEILKNWSIALDNWIEQGWYSKLKEFPLYTLRLLKGTLDQNQNNPTSQILRSEIEKLIQPLADSVQQLVPYYHLYESFEKIQNLLRDQETVDANEVIKILPEIGEVDVIDLLGHLAWFSKYRDKDLITPVNLIKWSGGSINDDNAANNFLSAGTRAGIFTKPTMNARAWSDQFVADSCAVMRINREENSGTIADMATVLVEQNATEILGLAADYDTFIRIMDVLSGNSERVPIEILEGIFSNHAVASLLMNYDVLDSINIKLINLSKKLSRSQNAQLSSLLARLAKTYPPLKEYMNQIKNSAENTAEIALLVIGRLTSPEQFENDCQHLTDDNNIHALYAAAELWENDEGKRLSQWCERSNFKNLGEKQEIFERWCNRQTDGILVGLLQSTLRNIQKNAPNNAYQNPAVCVTMDILLGRVCYLRESQLEEVAKAFTPLYQSELATASFNHIVNFLVHLYAPGITSQNVEWMPDNGFTIAVPKTPFGPDELRTIFDHFVDKSGSKANNRLSLANSAQLSTVEGISYRDYELVGNDLPNRLPIDEGGNLRIIDRSILTTWNGEQLAHIEQDHIRWRPLFRLRLD